MFSIDFKSRRPFYEQLVENIRAMVLSGALSGDDPLPSVRQLSSELGINPNTVQKAYAALEQQSVIYTIPGKGNFIRQDTESLRAGQEQALLRQLSTLAQELKALGVTLTQAQECLATAFQEGKE